MEWHDEAIVLAVHRHGEHDARLETLTAEHGRAFGLVKGGLSRRLRSVIQPGNRLSVTWRARVEHQLGNFTAEALGAHGLALARDPGRLLALTAATALVSAVLPEREPHRAVYDGLSALIALVDQCRDGEEDRLAWLTGFIRFEMGLLRDLGFGLDLESCAATGTRDDLVYVSPRTGRAVSRAAGRPYHDRLLPLPEFLTSPGEQAADLAAAAQGLELAGFFLERCLLAPHRRGLPAARQRLALHVAEKVAAGDAKALE
ncbi:MAG TPA: DNA repair protein RecO [Sphingomonadales bacterium]